MGASAASIHTRPARADAERCLASELAVVRRCPNTGFVASRKPPRLAATAACDHSIAEACSGAGM